MSRNYVGCETDYWGEKNADGNVIYDSGMLETQDDAKLANLDVSNIKMLSIEFNTDYPYSTYFVFGDPILTP